MLFSLELSRGGAGDTRSADGVNKLLERCWSVCIVALECGHARDQVMMRRF